MRVAIVDDEPLAREGLRLMLGAHPDLEVVGEAGNGRDGLALIARARPALALVDVQMPELSGLEMAAQLPRDLDVALVFVTAFDAYAVEAFEVHALDYLVKPVSEVRLAAALARARAGHQLRSIAHQAGQLAAALATLGPARGRPQLAIRDGQATVLVAIDDIDWVEAASYYVEIHARGKLFLHRETMQRLEATLDPERFVRIHRSRLINRDRIREVRPRGRGAVVLLDDGSAHEVARSFRARLRQLVR